MFKNLFRKNKLRKILKQKPEIIKRDSHCISRRNIDEDALKILYRLRRKNFTAYIVGGAVRDLLLGTIPKDFDIATDAPPEAIKKIFRNSRIIGHRFKLVQVIFRGYKVIEVSTFRKSVLVENQEVLADDNDYGTIQEDATRRDLTINSLYYDISNFTIIDYCKGLKDLKNGVIRAVGNPDERFENDPVRLLRAIRHAARNNFIIETETMDAVIKHRKNLKLCPNSRLKDEFAKDISSGNALAWFRLAHSTRVFYNFFPELEEYYGKEKSRARGELMSYLSKIDHAQNSENPYSPAITVAAIFYPVIKILSNKEDFPMGRAGRSQWNFFIRKTLPELAKGIQFTKKIIDMACHITGIAGYSRFYSNGQTIPQKTRNNKHFPETLEFIKLIEEDLSFFMKKKKVFNKKFTKPSGFKKRKPRE